MSMRITTSMLNAHSSNNIGSQKTLLDARQEQMTTQKKISRPSEDPVIAIRSLRLHNTMTEVTQYTDYNIPTASSWLEQTETSLTNMSKILNDVYTLCVNGATGTLTSEDRETILSNLSAFVKQLYAEGNADSAGRTIFTGYKTDTNLTFDEDSKSSYSITQKFGITDITAKDYFANKMELTTDSTTILTGYADRVGNVESKTYQRIRLAYSDLSETQAPTFTANYDDPADPTQKITENLAVETISYTDWEASGFAVDDDKIYYIPDTGELVLGQNKATELAQKEESNSGFYLETVYQKDTFMAGDVRPEMYFDCTQLATNTSYTRKEQDLSFTVSNNFDLSVNVQAGQGGILDTAIARDINELMDAVTAVNNADEKVKKLEALKTTKPYCDDSDAMDKLQEWIDAASNEKTVMDENLQNLFSHGITDFQNYKQTTDKTVTDVGSVRSRLELVKTRMTSQKTTIQELISSNDERELSDILIDYEAAYTAYQSSLTAASKLNQTTLMDLI